MLKLVLLIVIAQAVIGHPATPAAPAVPEEQKTFATNWLISAIGGSNDDNTNVNVNVADNSGNPLLKFNAATRIAVVGAGPAGLFAARQLSRAGYTNVVVFEKSNRWGGLVSTINFDGHAVDFTTRFIPAINSEGPGTQPLLQSMIDQYGLATRTTSAAVTYVDISGSQPIALAMPHIFADFFAPGGAGPNAIVADLVWGFEVLRVVNAVPGIAGCNAALGIPAGTSFGNWAQAINHPAFIRLAEYTNDMLLGGPSPQQDACAFLKIRSHFMPGDIVAVLRTFGLTNTAPLPLSDALRSCLNPAVNFNRKMFVNGYQSFFDAIVQNENFQVVTNAKVVSIKQKTQNILRVRLSDGSRWVFDKVVVAATPDIASQFIDDTLQIAPYLTAFSAPHYVTVNAFDTVPSTEITPFPATSPHVFNSVIYPAAYQLATTNMPDAVIGMNKEFDDSGLVIAIGYSPLGGTNRDFRLRAKSAVQSMGYKTQGQVFNLDVAYPVYATADQTGNGFFATIDALQGSSGHFFVGEAFSGYGVPSILAETTRVIGAGFMA